MDDDIPYLLLTPGPLTTTRRVRQAMQTALSTWDVDYNQIVTEIRQRLVNLATSGTVTGDEVSSSSDGVTSVLIQGSGTFAVESTIGSAIPADGRLLVLSNGAYGQRIALIANRLRISHDVLDFGETGLIDLPRLQQTLSEVGNFTHLAVCHCETTTGILNPVEQIGAVTVEHNVSFIIDAMSSFGGVPLTLSSAQADFLISSANKCIQGVPGFAFVIARRENVEACEGQARSLALDLFDQWRTMEDHGGKWRYTSPTHTVCAFRQALDELEDEGLPNRHQRYVENQGALAAGMQKIGFTPLLPASAQSPIITSFHFPQHDRFDFNEFYDRLKSKRFVIYPGKITAADTFRIANIGNVHVSDIRELLASIDIVMRDMGVSMTPANN